jgi:hypothetical protein
MACSGTDLPIFLPNIACGRKKAIPWYTPNTVQSETEQYGDTSNQSTNAPSLQSLRGPRLEPSNSTVKSHQTLNNLCISE